MPNCVPRDPLWNNQYIAPEALDQLSQRLAAALRQTRVQHQQSTVELSEVFPQGGWLDRRDLDPYANSMLRKAVRNPCTETRGLRNSARAYHHENVAPSRRDLGRSLNQSRRSEITVA